MSQAVQVVRNPPPRMLSSQETLYSLNHWISNFRTYYRRDSYFKCFLLPTATWAPNQDNYGQRADVTDGVVTRSAQDKGEDLCDFLNILIGYLPFPYLTEKILKATNNLQQVWDVIKEHYGLKITGESLLDFPTLQKNDEESFRQFYDRLLAHVRMHLAGPNQIVDGINTGPNGEIMTVSLMNFVAMAWLVKIHPTLLNIVRVEYSKELREGQSLAALVPRIAVNIEALLTKGGSAAEVSQLSLQSENAQELPTVRKINKKKQRSTTHSNSDATKEKSKLYCPECFYLSKKLQLKIDFKHLKSTQANAKLH